MKLYFKDLGIIYENMNPNMLATLVDDTLEWLLPIDDFEEAEDSCNMELDPIGMGKESVAYYANGIVLKINDSRNKEEWEQYAKLDCFVRTEVYDAEFGIVILQEKLQLDATEFLKNDAGSKIENCLKSSGLPYDNREITDENVGINNNGEWKLFDIPTT